MQSCFRYLDEAVRMLFSCFSKDYKPDNKAAVFLTFGLLALFVQSGIDAYKAKIFELIKSQLPTKDSSRSPRLFYGASAVILLGSLCVNEILEKN